MDHYEAYLDTEDIRHVRALAEEAEIDPEALTNLVYLCENMECDDCDGRRVIVDRASADPVALSAMAALLKRKPDLVRIVRSIISNETEAYTELARLISRIHRG